MKKESQTKKVFFRRSLNVGQRPGSWCPQQNHGPYNQLEKSQLQTWEKRAQRLQCKSRLRFVDSQLNFPYQSFFSIFRFFWGEWKSRVTAVKMVSPKKGWEFADASECLSFHYRNSSLYNTGLFNYINNLYAELCFGALSRTSYQRLRATLPRSLVRKLKYPNRGISNVSLLNSSVTFYMLRIFPGKMG